MSITELVKKLREINELFGNDPETPVSIRDTHGHLHQFEVVADGVVVLEVR